MGVGRWPHGEAPRGSPKRIAGGAPRAAGRWSVGGHVTAVAWGTSARVACSECRATARTCVIPSITQLLSRATTRAHVCMCTAHQPTAASGNRRRQHVDTATCAWVHMQDARTNHIRTQTALYVRRTDVRRTGERLYTYSVHTYTQFTCVHAMYTRTHLHTHIYGDR